MIDIKYSVRGRQRSLGVVVVTEEVQGSISEAGYPVRCFCFMSLPPRRRSDQHEIGSLGGCGRSPPSPASCSPCTPGLHIVFPATGDLHSCSALYWTASTAGHYYSVPSRLRCRRCRRNGWLARLSLTTSRPLTGAGSSGFLLDIIIKFL